jgi:sigma-B regulation protein RsbU (phosphoserine phosphatase)
MSIRWKFLIVLLIFGLIPLFVYAALSQRGMLLLGETISDLRYANRIRLVSKNLERTAADYAQAFIDKKEVLELALMVLARDVERVLAENPIAVSKDHFAENLNDADKSSVDLTRSSGNIRLDPNFGTAPVSMSFGQQVFRLAPGVDRRKVEEDIARLTRLLPLHKVLKHRLGDSLIGQYVSLENGVLVAFLDHGDNPSNYVPQNRAWFLQNSKPEALVWSVSPAVSDLSRQVTMSGNMLVRRPDGSHAGIVALDVLITGLLKAKGTSSLVSQHTQSFLVHLEMSRKTEKSGLRILAQKDFQQDSSSWSGTTAQKWLVSSDKAELKWLANGLEQGKSGRLEMPYNDVDSIWAYSSMDEGLGLVLVVPQEKISFSAAVSRDYILWLTRWQWLETAMVAIAVILALILIAFWRSRALVGPFLVMVEAMQSLAKEDFTARMDIAKGDERDLVANAFNEMVPQLEDRMRIRKSLEVAQEVQQNLLPEEIPELPGFDIAAVSIYCDETGGDYFDFIAGRGGSERLGIAVGDVTGHGVAAALLMATTRAHIRSLSHNQDDLAERITRVNSLLANDIRQTGNFVSLFFMEIEARSRAISWVRAGHDPALLFDPVTERFDELKGQGLVLGVDKDYSYEQLEKTIEAPGKIILIGTDGIWETQNSVGEMFGKNRLREIIRTNSDKTAQAIQNAVLEALSSFRMDAPQEDDITIVVIKTMPTGPDI